MSQEFYKKDDGNSLFSLSKDTLSEVWESKAIKSLRSALLNGEKPTACKACWVEEDYGAESKRMRENKRWGVITADATPTLKFLDLKLGSTCNLKCRICSPSSSSMWVKEHTDVYGHDVVTGIGKTVSSEFDKRMIMQWPDYNERFWTDIDAWLPTVELLEIYGGEPFLIKRHFELLRKSIELGYSKKQKIHYNTNGTIFPQDAVDNIWPHFKEVDVMFSIDGIGKQFEYQRFPATWSNVENTLHRFVTETNCLIQVCLTVSALNVYYLPETLSYFIDKNINVWLNVLYTPGYFNIQNLPPRVKEAITTKLTDANNNQFTPILSYLNSGIGTDELSNLKTRLTKHDVYRQQSYEQIFPEYSKLLYA